MISAHRRVVLLGASNLTQGLDRVLGTLRSSWPAPLDILAAVGHGRSYGAPSRVLWRTLPGIAECGLWNELSARPPLPTVALLTDLGNDIVYGHGVATIAGWAEECLDRLSSRCERVVITELPLESTRGLSEHRFRLFRRLFFPGSAVTLAGAISAAAELNERLSELAQRYGAQVVKPAIDWFGIDAIHYRWGRRSLAWQTFLTSLIPPEALPRGRGGSWYWWSYWASRRPQQRKFLGRAWQGAQPAVRLRDGTTVSFY